MNEPTDIEQLCGPYDQQQDFMEAINESTLTPEQKARWWQECIWDAINKYAVACGADPNEHGTSSARMDAVALVERVLLQKPLPIPCAETKLAGIVERLKQEQEYDRWHFSEQQPLSQLVRILDHKRHRVVSVIQASRAFQEDVLTFLRAFSLMLETVGGAATHGEKAARLRGLTELVETAAMRVRKRQFREDDAISFSMADDVFRCDYPVRHWIEKAREAEARASAAEKELSELRKE